MGKATGKGHSAEEWLDEGNIQQMALESQQRQLSETSIFIYKGQQTKHSGQYCRQRCGSFNQVMVPFAK
jgi:hypothetical protein